MNRLALCTRHQDASKPKAFYCAPSSMLGSLFLRTLQHKGLGTLFAVKLVLHCPLSSLPRSMWILQPLHRLFCWVMHQVRTGVVGAAPSRASSAMLRACLIC